jgi:2-desacetyl-2-hydroxyethyl bacteriochlorophyllide A dehydrogenase
MQAAVTSQDGNTQVITMTVPQSSQNLALVKVAATGICGTDRHIVQGEFPATFPRVLGHEICGIIESIESETFKVGQAVAIDPNIPCYTCEYCRRGEVHLCTHRRAIGIDWNGGFAEFVLVPEGQIYVLGDSVPIENGVFAEPLSCCIHGVDRLALKSGNRIVVVGLGPIGILLSLLIAQQGANTVIGIEDNPARREAAQQFGLTVISWSDLNFNDYARDADAIVDASGSGHILEWAVDAVRPGGTILVFGVAAPKDVAHLSPYMIYRKEITIVSAVTNPFTMQRAVTLLNTHAIDVTPLLTDRISLTEVSAALHRSPEGFKTFLAF